MTTINRETSEKLVLCNSPLVAEHYKVLTHDECEHFIKISKQNLKRALVSSDSKGIVSQGRTGLNTWLSHDHDEITKRVAERIAGIVGMPLENSEKFQVVHYGVNEEYRPHFDSWIHDGSEKTHRCMKWGGARVKTALCYLNDVAKGGGTKMTKLNLTITAEKGKVLIFDNTISTSDNTRHELSEHAGLPVEEGEKFAFNLWFRECNSKMLYKDFNPSYYHKKQNNYLALTNTPEHLDVVDRQIGLLPNFLQIGDFIPFIEMHGENSKKHIHNYCNSKPFLIITVKDLENMKISETLHLHENFNTIVLFESGDLSDKPQCVFYTKDQQLGKMLEIGDEVKAYIATPNRRIVTITDGDGLRKLKEFDPISYLPNQVHIPYLLIENALDNELLAKVIEFYNTKKSQGKLVSHQHSTKDRLHVHPDAELEKEIDHKISRSVLPELKKVFYFDAEYRETYKICSYNAETSGRFHAHRDTPSPFQHRKYALSLFLNDDYEGGEFVLPEYGLKLKPKANTAFIFPGINTHQVLPVTKGSRMTIISFFVNGSTKPKYKMKAHYYKDKKIVDSEIYPL